ncbi:LacI family DNA-binding transcriptional regulator [Desulfococcaceae bacterium HSG9]|nr:LacI family DNA-binding transcriptional regulator [Desulfococcaceae bacterium HSG9]
MATKKTTIYEIAKIAGVSHTAVSMALNNRPGVSQATRRKILEIASKLNYQPNHIAKTLVTKRSYIVGLIIDNIANPFFPELTKGIEEKANESGYNLLLCNTGQDLEKEKKAIEMFKSKGVDGIILTTVTVDDPHIKPLIEERFPFVCLIRHPLYPYFKNKVDYVVIDNFLGAYKGGKHLYRLGHDRIAVLTGPMNVSTAVGRTQGFKKAFEEQGITLDPSLIKECRYSRSQAYAAAVQLLKLKNRPTAFYTEDDTMAIGVRDAVLEAGLRIPEDIALVGFDNIEMSALTGVDITTIKQRKYEMGVTGVTVLIDKIEKAKPHIVNKAVLEPELIIRKSCGYHPNGYKR